MDTKKLQHENLQKARDIFLLRIHLNVPFFFQNIMPHKECLLVINLLVPLLFQYINENLRFSWPKYRHIFNYIILCLDISMIVFAEMQEKYFN